MKNAHPCYWCGAAGVIFENYGGPGWHVECPECGARGPLQADKPDALKSWNTIRKEEPK